MDFYINKVEVHYAFNELDGSNYRTRNMISLFGSAAIVNYPNEELRNFFLHTKSSSESHRIDVVCPSDSEKEYLKEESSFTRKNIKLNFSLDKDRALSITGVLYLLSENYDTLIHVVSQFPKENSYLIGNIILVGGKLSSSSEAYIEGYCEGIKVLTYLHGEP